MTWDKLWPLQDACGQWQHCGIRHHLRLVLRVPRKHSPHRSTTPTSLTRSMASCCCFQSLSLPSAIKIHPHFCILHHSSLVGSLLAFRKHYVTLLWPKSSFYDNSMGWTWLNMVSNEWTNIRWTHSGNKPTETGLENVVLVSMKTGGIRDSLVFLF